MDVQPPIAMDVRPPIAMDVALIHSVRAQRFVDSHRIMKRISMMMRMEEMYQYTLAEQDFSISATMRDFLSSVPALQHYDAVLQSSIF